MQDLFKIFTDAWGQLGRLPLAGVLAFSILVVGFSLKKWRSFPNQIIPAVTLALGSFGYAALGDPAKVTSVAAGWRQYVVLWFYGLILAFVVWGSHRYVIKRLAKVAPDGLIPPDSFDTQPPFPTTTVAPQQPTPAPQVPNAETKGTTQ